MIKLDVEEYCHDCPAFEIFTLSSIRNDYIIRCKNKRVCDLIKKHLEKTTKTETGDDKNE